MPDQKRLDPPRSRVVDGDINDALRIENRDPKRSYRLANPNDFYSGVPHLVAQEGFEVELARKDGPRIAGLPHAKDGSEIAAFGQFLVSRPLELEQKAAERARDVAAQRANATRRLQSEGLVGPGAPAQFVADPGEYIERVRS